MRNIFLCILATVLLSGCLEKEQEKNLTSSPKPKLASYNNIVPDSTENSSTTITIKATQCRSLYYDKLLLGIESYFDGDWIRKNKEWKYVGKDVIFVGLVKAYYRITN